VLPVPQRSDAATTWKRWLFGMSGRARMLLYEETASLVGAGFGIREALADLMGRSGGRRRRALERLADAVHHGVPVGEAMLGFPEHFAPVEARLVAAGEKTGRLDRAFRDAAAEIARARVARDRFVKSAAYPVFLLHFALFVPSCVLASNRSSGSAATLQAFAICLVAWGAVAALTTLHLSRRDTPGWGRALAHLPLVGPVARSAAISRASRVTAALHDAGEDLPSTLSHAADACGNGWVASELRDAAGRVQQGVPLTAALVGVGAFGTDARHLVETGERSGTLSESFRRIAELEDQRFSAAAVRLAVAVGAVVFAVVVLWVLQMAYGVFVAPLKQFM
jgi:type II secretory pathway component PulF